MAADRLNLPISDLIETLGGRALTTSVYDHLFTGEQAMAERVMSFAKIDGYSVSSNKLAQLYGTHSKLPAPDAVVTDGVDLGVFHSEGARRHSNPVPVIGWVGNSAWGKSRGRRPQGLSPAVRSRDRNSSRAGHSFRGRNCRSAGASHPVSFLIFTSAPRMLACCSMLADFGGLVCQFPRGIRPSNN